MKDLQKSVVRASTIARLDEIIRDLSSAREIRQEEEREWCAALLHPLNDGDAPGTWRLNPSPRIAPELGNALLAVLVAEFRAAPDSLEALTEAMRNLGGLRIRLGAGGPLDEAEAQTALDIARRLRRHFIGVRVPSAPKLGLA